MLDLQKKNDRLTKRLSEAEREIIILKDIISEQNKLLDAFEIDPYMLKNEKEALKRFKRRAANKQGAPEDSFERLIRKSQHISGKLR